MLTSRPALHVAQRGLFAVAVLLASAIGAAHAQDPSTRHAPVSAHAAQLAVSRGAVVVDVRNAQAFAQASLPGAVSVPEPHDLNNEALARAVSLAGIDLSRDVLLVDEPGSDKAQALHQRLVKLASGNVQWLVGGVMEWQAVGVAAPAGELKAKRLGVPQHLVALPQAQAAVQATNALGTAKLATQQSSQLYGYSRLY
jgi:rhodanese-related sulfurtransferase